MADSSLAAIQTKVRRLTRSPSENQLPTATLDEYINTAVLYDFPSILRLFKLKTTFTFWTIPNVDQYSTNTTVPTNPLSDFDNKYITTHEPVYIGGYHSYFTQSREEFFGMWPLINSQQQIAVGDGATTVFSNQPSLVPSVINNVSQQIQSPVLQNNVTFSAIDVNNNALTLHDVPVVDAAGNPTSIGNLYVPGFEPAAPPTVQDPVNYINYLTGAYVVTFMNDQNAITPPSGNSLTNSPNQNAIWCQAIPYIASIPTSILYYDYTFTLRPVPDISYPVTMEVYIQPTQLLATDQNPQLNQWWQYIAYLAAKKIFEDRMDQESVQLLMPELKNQELQVLRTTLKQLDNQQASSIYRQQASNAAGPIGGGWWGGN